MRKTFLCFTFSLIISASCFCQGTPSEVTQEKFKQLEWLLGKWNRTNVRPGSSAFENWKKVSDISFEGLGVSMKGSDTTFVESLKLEIRNDKIFYIADVSQNATPTLFEVKEVTDKYFSCENYAHDFPKVISYSLEANKDLKAIISDGGDKKMLFTFVRDN